VRKAEAKLTWKLPLLRPNRSLAVFSGTFLGGGFWGLVIGVAAEFLFGIPDDDAILFVGLPAAILIAILIKPYMARAFGYDS
jgi:hypothetical protein